MKRRAKKYFAKYLFRLSLLNKQQTFFAKFFFFATGIGLINHKIVDSSYVQVNYNFFPVSDPILKTFNNSIQMHKSKMFDEKKSKIFSLNIFLTVPAKFFFCNWNWIKLTNHSFVSSSLCPGHRLSISLSLSGHIYRS